MSGLDKTQLVQQLRATFAHANLLEAPVFLDGQSVGVNHSQLLDEIENETPLGNKVRTEIEAVLKTDLPPPGVPV